MEENKLFTECEIFYQNTVNDPPNLPEHDSIKNQFTSYL